MNIFHQPRLSISTFGEKTHIYRSMGTMYICKHDIYASNITRCYTATSTVFSGIEQEYPGQRWLASSCITFWYLVPKARIMSISSFFVRKRRQQRLRSTPLRCSRTVLGSGQLPNTGIITCDPPCKLVQKSTYVLMFLAFILSKYDITYA